VEVRNWVKGLITEVSPLTYPENASVEEVNFVLNTDGSRHRRYGMDFETGAAATNTTISDRDAALSIYNWENPGGYADKDFLVVQVGNEITVLEQQESLSYNIVHVKKFDGVNVKTRFTFTSVDGLLIVSTGQKQVHTMWFKDYAKIVWTEGTLKVRDLFGVEDKWNNIDLKSGNEISTRPAELLEPHIYNLRNQTWGIERRTTGNTVEDPITAFKNAYTTVHKELTAFPSNSDQVTQALYADSNDDTGRTVDRFHPRDLVENPIGNFEAPTGHFIIDLFERGASRMESLTRMKDKYPSLEHPVTTLPTDKTPGGVSVVGEYAGRVWYGGLSGEIIDGDEKSPRLSSYVLFSRLVRDPTDITQCYQVGDPTSKDNPDIIDTDGGFIRIDGAYGIRGFVNVDTALAVLAANGVWLISGGESGFSATNHKIQKIHDRGIIGDNTLVVVDNTFLFWASEGIYHAKRNEYGEWSVENITKTTIQTLFDRIGEKEKQSAFGVYDTYERRARWVYQNNDDGLTRELILDATLGSFYINKIGRIGEGTANVIAPVLTLPVAVDAFGDIRRREVKYLTIVGYEPTTSYKFAHYVAKDYTDWSSTGFGSDAKAYMLTGFISGGDYQRKKQLAPLTFHMRNTEGTFYEDEDGNLVPENPCSCLARVQWEWSNNVESGKWSKQFQVYRKRRLYYYEQPGQSDGYPVVSSKTNLRGSGRVFAIYLETEPKHDCNILGWSMVMGMNTDV
jgi:hypothetical protein